MPKYDISGLLCISIGCVGIVMYANKEEQDFTSEQTVAMLTSWKCVVFVVMTFTLFLINQIIVYRLNTTLRNFEQEVDSFVKVQSESS